MKDEATEMLYEQRAVRLETALRRVRAMVSDELEARESFTDDAEFRKLAKDILAEIRKAGL